MPAAKPKTTTSTGPLPFHADFCKPANAQIFTTSDGVAFRYNLDVLCLFSTFFADLNSLPVPSIGQKPIIDLPSATSHGLAYAFGAVNSVIRGLPPPGLPSPSSTSNLYQDVIKIADAYDLPVVLRALFRTAKAAKTKPTPFMLFTLATLSKSSDEIAELIGPLLAVPIHEMDKWSEKILRSKDPLALVDLHSFYGRFGRAMKHFLDALDLASEQTKDDNRSDYAYAKDLIKTHLLEAKSKATKSPHLVTSQHFYDPNTGCATCDRRINNLIEQARFKHIPDSIFALTR